MIAVVQFLGSWLGRSRGMDREPASAGADNAGHRREPPIMLAEIIAASSLLDFGGIPDARYFHALYDWRLSEAEKIFNQRLNPENGAPCQGNMLQCPKRNFQRRL